MITDESDHAETKALESEETMRFECLLTRRTSIAVTALLSALLALPLNALAQDAGVAGFVSPLREGARALQFQVAQNFTLSSFQGSTLSYKSHRSALSAIRFGVSLSGSDTDSDIKHSDVRQDTVRVDQVGWSEDNGVSVALTGQMLRYRASASRVVPFIGFGPGASFSRSHYEYRLEQETPQPGAGGEQSTQQVDRTSHQTKAWISGAAGVEWLAGRQFSLHAEYGLRVGYQWRHTSEIHQEDSGGSNYRHEDTSDGNG